MTHHENEERYEGTAIVVSPVYPVRRVIPNLKVAKRRKPYPLDTWIINVQKGDLMDWSIILEKKNISQINLSFKNIYICPSTTSLPTVLDF